MTHPMFERPIGHQHTNANAASTSQANAARINREGISTARKALIVGHLESAGFIGMTCPEIETATGLRHQSASSLLSNLHEDGVIVALEGKENTRNGSGVYVMPDQVVGRPVRAFISNAQRREERFHAAGGPFSQERTTETDRQAALYAQARSSALIPARGPGAPPMPQQPELPAYPKFTVEELDVLNHVAHALRNTPNDQIATIRLRSQSSDLLISALKRLGI